MLSYFKTVFTQHATIPSEVINNRLFIALKIKNFFFSKFNISADDSIRIGSATNENEIKEVLANLGKNLPLLTRSHNGGTCWFIFLFKLVLKNFIFSSDSVLFKM